MLKVDKRVKVEKNSVMLKVNEKKKHSKAVEFIINGKQHSSTGHGLMKYAKS